MIAHSPYDVVVILFFLLFSFSSLSSTTSSPSVTNYDVVDLLAFKSSLSDAAAAAAALSSWNPSVEPCLSSSSSSWLGVSCRRGRVVRLVLEGLRLDGPIDHLTLLPYLSFLSLKNNSFSSPALHRLDFSYWSAHLKVLHLSHNRFSGPFPTGVLRLRRLRRLSLAGNLISGSIPPEIGRFLRQLLTLRLEENELIGGIPVSLGCIQVLADLNVSNNRLVGEIPLNLSSFPPSSFAGNLLLCGDPLPQKCPNWAANGSPKQPNSKNRIKRKWAISAAAVAVAAAAAVIASITATALYCLKRRVNGGDMMSEMTRGGKAMKGETEKMVFFEGCHRFELEDLLRGSAEMLGRGPVGTTYRVVLDAGEEGLVVKRVRRSEKNGWKEQAAEEERLLREIGRWRHPNVVRLRAYYSSPEELLLVYDYLPNGNLFDLLHGNRGPGRIPLEWHTRLKLAMDAARGLAYLHSASKSMLLCRQHLTSSNVLVDGHGNACISDFGLVELVLTPPPPPPSSSSFSRTLNPNTTGENSQKNDVYQFGVILLEILTGRPAQDCDMDLAAWVQRVVREEWTSEVFDIELGRSRDVASEDEMFGLLQVALLCVSRVAKDRPRMAVVYKMMEDIQDRGNRSRGSLNSPSLHDHSYESSSPCLSEDAPTFFTSC